MLFQNENMCVSEIRMKTGKLKSPEKVCLLRYILLLPGGILHKDRVRVDDRYGGQLTSGGGLQPPASEQHHDPVNLEVPASVLRAVPDHTALPGPRLSH